MISYGLSFKDERSWVELEMSQGENTTVQGGLWRKTEPWDPGMGCSHQPWGAHCGWGPALPMSGPVGDQTCAGRTSQAARCGAQLEDFSSPAHSSHCEAAPAFCFKSNCVLTFVFSPSGRPQSHILKKMICGVFPPNTEVKRI